MSKLRTDPFSARRARVSLTARTNCRRLGIDPYTYLRDVLTRLPNMTNRQIPQFTELESK